jgi:hypothetical protein
MIIFFPSQCILNGYTCKGSRYIGYNIIWIKYPRYEGFKLSSRKKCHTIPINLCKVVHDQWWQLFSTLLKRNVGVAMVLFSQFVMWA